MYITSDLFGGAANDQSHIDRPYLHQRSPVPDTQHGGGLGKRKRQYAETPSCTYESLPTASCHLTHHILSVNRAPTRLRALPCQGHPNSTSSTYPTSPKYTTSERRPVKQIKRLTPKCSLTKSASHLMDIEPEPLSVSPPNYSYNLIPCHACQSAPKRKRDLENYLDCRRCDGRTCYICARRCYGGCGKAVCKKCTVEVGQEGDPWCLDCYSQNINS